MNHLGSSLNADSVSGGLGWGLRFCISSKCQVIPVLLIHGPDSEKQGPKALHHQLHLAARREKSMWRVSAGQAWKWHTAYLLTLY